MHRVIHPLHLKVVVVFCLLLALGGLQLVRSAPAHASCGGGPVCGVTVTATASNTNGDMLLLDLLGFNSNPSLLIQATQVYAGAYDAHPIGVWYDTYDQKWAIVNEDLANIPLNSAFFLTGTFGPDGPYQITNGSVWADAQVTATSANVSGDYVDIDSPVTNGNPHAQVYVTQVIAFALSLNPHEVGVYYDLYHQKWSIFNEDLSAMPTGVQFNVTVTNEQNDESQLTTATSSSTSGYIDYINNYIKAPFTPRHISQVYYANATCGCVLNPHTVALWEDFTLWGGIYWAIYNVDKVNMPINAQFFVEM